MTLNQEAFKKILKEQGLKVTNQRLLVLEVLEKHRGEHMTAEDIYELVKVDYPEIGLATYTGRYSCYWNCNWWIGLIWMMDVSDMKSEP